MELTEKKFEELMSTELIGKDVGYSYWNLSGAALKLIRILAKEAGLNETDFSYETYRGSNSTIYLTYKRVSFGDVSFKKQKGSYKYGRYEWIFKQIFVNFWNETGYSSYKGLTFQEMLNAIDAELVAKADDAEQRKQQGKEVIELLKTTYNLDNYGVRQLIDYLAKNKYSLTD